MTQTAPAPADRISYADLYARWEQGNWRASELDFAEDARQWREEFTEFERKAALWNYALFFWGEDAVTDGLSPYIDAAPREEQKYFLATQQVDEARHAVFFARFMHEVAGIGDGTVGSGLQAIKPQLTWGFVKIFDRLVSMAKELRRDRSKPKLAAAITLYHFIIEASLAQPGQHFITSYLHERDLLPGFREGMDNVQRDEQRHIGFGVKMLSELAREDPRCREAVADLLREVLPWTGGVLVPPGWDRRYTEVFGATLEDLGEEGAASLQTKLRSAGLALETLPGPPAMPVGLTPREQAERGQAFARANLLHDGDGPPARDRETQALMFDTIRRSVNPDHGLDGPTTFQWDFKDVEPWHVTIDDGDATAAPGRTPDADLSFATTWDNWVAMFAGRLDPRWAVVTGRLRPRGKLTLLPRMGRIFPR